MILMNDCIAALLSYDFAGKCLNSTVDLKENLRIEKQLQIFLKLFLTERSKVIGTAAADEERTAYNILSLSVRVTDCSARLHSVQFAFVVTDRHTASSNG